MISIQEGRRTHRDLIKIMILQRATEMALTAGLEESGRLVTQEVRRILSTGPRTGRVYTIRGRKHQASAPGEAPARLTGKLIDSVGYRASGSNTLVVGEEAEHARFLERGTRKMARRPHLEVAVRNTGTEVMSTLSEYLMEIHR